MCLAIPGRILGTTEVDGTVMADVDFGGVRKEVCLQYIPDAAVGEYVVVHVGFAIQRLDEKSALETLASFDKLGILAEEFGDGLAVAAQHEDVPHTDVPQAQHVPHASGPRSVPGGVHEGAGS